MTEADLCAKKPDIYKIKLITMPRGKMDKYAKRPDIHKIILINVPRGLQNDLRTDIYPKRYAK